MFSPPAAVTLPYDRTRIHPDQASDLSVLRLVDGAPAWVEVEPIAVDLGAGTVTVLASGFSDWVVFDTNGAPSCTPTACQDATLTFTDHWSCTYAAQPDNTACDDGNGCTSGDSCLGGACAVATGCAASASCQGSGSGAACACNPGFSGNGQSCQDVNECASGNGGCDANATCTNLAGSRACACNAGYNGDGLTCTLDNHFQVIGMAFDFNHWDVLALDGAGAVRHIGAFTGIDGLSEPFLLSPDGLTLYGLAYSTPVDDEVGRAVFTMDLTTGQSTSAQLAIQAPPYEPGTPLGVLDGQIVAWRGDPSGATIVLIDPRTGEQTPYATVPVNAGQGVVAFDAVAQLLFVVDAQTLTTYDRNGAVVHQVPFTPSFFGGIEGPTADGLLVTTRWNGVDTVLITIDPATGVVVPRGGPLGTVASAWGMTYDGGTNTAYAIDTGDIVHSVNLTTGASTSVGSVSYAKQLTLAKTTSGCADNCVSRVPGPPAAPCTVPNTVCDINATCTPGDGGSYTCECVEGSVGDGMICKVNNVCMSNNGGCAPNAFCQTVGPLQALCTCRANSTGDGINCPCDVGYELRSNSCRAINPCSTNHGGCDRHAICSNTGPGTRSCTCVDPVFGDGETCGCQDGYVVRHLSGVNAACLAIDVCAESPNGGCDPHATCTPQSPGNRECSCNDTWVTSGHGPGGNVTCTCPFGHRSDGTICQPIDACLETPNGGCGPNAICTNVGPNQRTCACVSGYQTLPDDSTCTRICPPGYEGLTSDDCHPVSGFGLYGVVANGDTTQVLAIVPQTGTGTPLGAAGAPKTSGAWQLDFAGKHAFTIGTSQDGVSHLYTFDAASYTMTAGATGQLQEIVGTHFDGRVLGSAYDVGTWRISVSDPVTGAAGSSVALTGLLNTTVTSIAFDPARNLVYAIGSVDASPQQWLLTADMTTGTVKAIQTYREVKLAGVNAAGNLIAAQFVGYGWFIVEVDTATGAFNDWYGVMIDLSPSFDGVLVLDHTASLVYAHGQDSDGVYRFYTADLANYQVSSVEDLTSDPAHLTLMRASGACVGDGCAARDPGDIDPCWWGSAGCSDSADCTSSGPNQSSCQCSEGYQGDGYTCVPIP